MEQIKGFFDDHRWLSNFWPCQITYLGHNFGSVEAAYQAAKCANRKDFVQFCELSAKDAKLRSKIVKCRAGWSSIKYHIMSELVFYKFLYNSRLREMLVQTNDAELIEDNMWNDTYWGVCNGTGENNLGKILMATRQYFKNSNK